MLRLRKFLALIIWFTFIGSSNAQAPPIDTSLNFFSGEWTGTGSGGKYCYVSLNANGWGQVLIDGGTGDWLGARVQWRNVGQSLRVEKIIPLAASSELRLTPFTELVLSGGFNMSLSLTWGEKSNSCQLQKVETTANKLIQARKTIKTLPPRKNIK